MINGTDSRAIALEILMEITQEKEYSHIAIRNALDKVGYLPKQERAFINRLVEGTLDIRSELIMFLISFPVLK